MTEYKSEFVLYNIGTPESPRRKASDFIDMKMFLSETEISKRRLKELIKDRDSNGATLFLHQIDNGDIWYLSPSLFKEWKNRKEKQNNKTTGETE